DPKYQKAMQRDSKPQSNTAHGVNTKPSPSADSKPAAPPSSSQLPETPAEAPKMIAFPANIEKDWSKLWDDTYAAHDKAQNADMQNTPPLKETGYTVERRMFSGELANTQVGGVASDSDWFQAGWYPDPGYRTTGVFHLHDYPTKSRSGSVDGADAASMVQRGDAFIVARSGTAKDGVNEYMFVRTAATKDLPANSQDETDATKIKLLAKGVPFDQATRQAALDFAKNHDLVYYEGSNGKFKRVYPP
ncbi:MAG TPA: hypothetical protein VFV07_02320, partial [Rhizomicrobium sp.]|nr:hypothetical protein [Rhizomicrobium sp.]